MQDEHSLSVQAFQDLMIWAVLLNHSKLAQFFWESGNYSIPSALVASRLFIAVARSPFVTTQGSLRDQMLKMEALSKKFEAFAAGVLGSCYLEDPDFAKAILRMPLKKFPMVHRERKNERKEKTKILIFSSFLML